MVLRKQPSMETQVVDFDGKLDLELLKAQRQSLRTIIDEDTYDGILQTDLEGIDELLAFIYDQLVPPGSEGGDDST